MGEHWPLDLAPFADDYSGSYLEALSTELSAQEEWETAEEALRSDVTTAVALGILDEDEEFAYVDQLLAEQVSHEYAEIASDELQAERAGLLNGFLVLLNTPGVKEEEIEAILKKHPLFLRGLNYTEVYHQVILPLGDGESLRPDIIAEPVTGNWAE